MGLDLYEILLEVEQEFDIRISDVQMQSVKSIGDLFDLTVQHLREEHPERFTKDSQYSDNVWQQLKALLVHQLGLNPDQVVKSARFFHELGFD